MSNGSHVGFNKGFIAVSYGRQWKNLSLEYYLGMTKVDFEKNRNVYSDERSLSMGVQLNFKIPIVNPKKTLIGK